MDEANKNIDPWQLIVDYKDFLIGGVVSLDEAYIYSWINGQFNCVLLNDDNPQPATADHD